MEEQDTARASHLRGRARRLYLRARGYGLRGLEVKHPGFEQKLRADAKAAAASTTKADVPLLFWTASAWGAAISLSKDDPGLIAEQPLLEALIDRALALDESYDSGAIHGFLISYEPSRPGGEADARRALPHAFRPRHATYQGPVRRAVAFHWPNPSQSASRTKRSFSNC